MSGALACLEVARRAAMAPVVAGQGARSPQSVSQGKKLDRRQLLPVDQAAGHPLKRPSRPGTCLPSSPVSPVRYNAFGVVLSVGRGRLSCWGIVDGPSVLRLDAASCFWRRPCLQYCGGYVMDP